MIDVLWVFAFEHGRDVRREAGPPPLQQRKDLAVWVADDFSRPRLMFLPEAAGSLHSFEGVTQRPVPDVVEQRGKDGHFGARFIVGFADLATNDLKQAAGGVEHADAMRKARVGRPWKNEIGRAELLDAPEPLELGRVEERPGQLFKFDALAERDQPMDRIANALVPGFMLASSRLSHRFDSNDRARSKRRRPHPWSTAPRRLRAWARRVAAWEQRLLQVARFNSCSVPSSPPVAEKSR